MSIVEYYRDFYHQKFSERVAVLTALKIYQELEEMKAERPTYELLPDICMDLALVGRSLLLRCGGRFLVFCDGVGGLGSEMIGDRRNS